MDTNILILSYLVNLIKRDANNKKKNKKQPSAILQTSGHEERERLQGKTKPLDHGMPVEKCVGRTVQVLVLPKTVILSSY